MEKRLIFLSSGWGKVDLAWNYLSHCFRKAGYDVITASYPLRGFVDIRKTGEEVGKALSVLDKEYKHICFIGHSMGGLVGRHLIQDTEYGSAIDSYISIGTPHGGSPMAWLAPWSTSARQMKLHSDFIESLNNKSWNKDIPALTLSGQWDTLVWPSARATFDPADHTVIERTTHTGLLLHPRVFQEAWSWLTYGIFSEVGFPESPGYASKLSFEAHNGTAEGLPPLS